MEVRLSDAEFRVMEILWREGEQKAARVAELAGEENGWEKNTVYTLLHRLVRKGAVRRGEPGFLCTPLLSRGEVRRREAENFLRRLYGGSLKLFVQSFLRDGKISEKEMDELRRMIDEYREGGGGR